MRIGIDIRSTLKKRTGIGQYTFSLINHLAKLDSGNEYLLYSKKKLFDYKRKLPQSPGRNFRHRVDYFSRGPEKILGGIDIFHTSSYDLIPPAGAKLVLVVHDVIIKAYPQGHTKETIETADKQLKNILKYADAIIVNSYSTKNDLLRWYDVKGDKVETIYLGVHDWFNAQNVSDGKYLLFVGTIEPRKNISGVVKAFTKLKKNQGIEHKLVIIGMKGWMCDSILNEINTSEFKSEIILKEYLKDNAELRQWYNHATALVFPSFYEGFGFPIIEAFACGAPVVTSNVAACKEVAGDAALLVNPSSIDEIAQAISSIIRDNKIRTELIQKGAERAKLFTWDDTARKTLAVFNKFQS